MKALSKERQKQITQLRANMELALGELNRRISDYNDKVAELFGDVEDSALELRGYVDEYNELLQECAGEVETYYDDKSLRWQESEKGDAYDTWRDALQSAGEVDFEDPETPEPIDETELESFDDEPPVEPEL